MRYHFLSIAIIVIGIKVSLFFSFFIYPMIQEPYHVVLDPDEYGIIGINVFHGYGFSRDKINPTIYRGPLYPLFIAAMLTLSGGWYPGSIWVAQSVLQGLTCFFVYLMAMKCFNRKIAFLSGFGCCFYPILFWYTPRLWNEPLLTFLFTLLMYILIMFIEKSTIIKAISILGLLSLTKATFLPLIIILPVSFAILFRLQKRTFINLLLIPLTAILTIMPWTIRNYLLTKNVY